MTAYRRRRIAGGTCYFTVCVERRGTAALTAHIDALRPAWSRTSAERPFRTAAVVILPDHLHAVWTLPDVDDDFSTRWRRIRSRFSRATGLTGRQSPSRSAKKERGIWHCRFWKHAVRNDDDLAICIAYCRINPVQHGLVA